MAASVNAWHVLVIGGGIIGLTSAYSLVQRGYQVTVLDKEPEENNGCSHGNAGMVVPSHFIPLAAPGMISMGLRMMPNPKSPFGIQASLSPSLLRWMFQFWKSANSTHVKNCSPILRDLNLASRKAYEQMASELGEGLGFTKRGLLMLCQLQSTLDEEAHVAEQATQLGLHAKVLTGNALMEADPSITMKAAGAIHFEDDCHLSPHDFMHKLKTFLVQKGVTFIHGTELTGFTLDQSTIRSVQTAGEDIVADEYVLATGSWSEKIAAQLKLNLPIQPGKGYSMTLTDVPELPKLCSILTEARVAATPMNGSLRFAGTMEIGASGTAINANRVQGIVESIPQFFPKFTSDKFKDQPVWSGLRPCSPEGMPYIGFSLGPVTGNLVAEIIAGASPSIPLQLVNPDRFN